MPEQAEFLAALIRVSRIIADEFGVSHIRKPRVSLSIVAFLRSDIFSFVRTHAREPEKLTHSRISWNDSELLWRVVEHRFRSIELDDSNEEFSWRDYFVDRVREVDIEDFIISRVMPRPRDIIYFIRAALVRSKNRGHFIIEERDVLDAEEEYSSFAIDLLLAEVGHNHPSITKALVYEFIGEDEILTENRVKGRLELGGVACSNLDKILDVLIDHSFLAIETSRDMFVFVYEDSERDRIRVKARKFRDSGISARFRIHPAFHRTLEIAPVL